MNKNFFLLTAACLIQAPLRATEEAVPRTIMVRDYSSMLTAVAVHDPLQLYSDEMAADSAGCGIIRTEAPEGYSYTMIPGMEDQSMKELSQSQYDYYVHWVEQGSLQGEEEPISPLMMFEEGGKENLEEAKKTLALEQQQQQRNHQATDKDESDSFGSQQRGQNPPVIKEERNYKPPSEIQISVPPDDISDMTGDCTTLDNHNHRSPVLSPKGAASIALLRQAEDKLRKARKESSAAREHFDFSQARWEVFQNLERASKINYEFQQQLGIAWNNYQYALETFQQAQVAAGEAEGGNDSSCAELNQKVVAAGEEVHRTFQEHQALIFPGQNAYQNYCFAQQSFSQHQLMFGVDYTAVFNKAQLRANRAAHELDKCQKEVRRIKFEQPRTPRQKTAGALPKKTTALVEKEQGAQVVERISENEGGSLIAFQRAEVAVKAAATGSDEISYKDQGTQISEEDLAAWKREAFFKKQALWKSRFHKMVEKMKQLKKAVVSDFSKQLLHEVSQEFIFNVSQTSLAEEQNAAAAKRQAAIASEVTDLLHGMIEKVEKITLAPPIIDALIKEVLSAKWATKYFAKIANEAQREVALEKQQAEKKLLLVKKKKIFSDLFYSQGETTEREKWEHQQESAARIRAWQEAERAEMEQFCFEYMNLLHLAEEVSAKKEKNLADTPAPLIQRARAILTQCYRRPYEWCSDAIQLMQDWKAIQVEAGKKTEEFFADQGRRIIDVPTAEYALKNGQIAQQLYNERVAKRREEEALVNAVPREPDPRKELGYFEQLPLMFEGPVFKRFVTNFFENKVMDPNRESDERARDYFHDIGKPDPRIFEFWKKSAEIEEQLKKERLKKAEEFLEKFTDEEERLRVAREWGLGWRERLQQEREEKKNEKLKQDLFAKEERRQRIVQAVLDERAAQEAERQKIEKELLDQEAKEKAQSQGKKKKTPKKK